MSAAATNIAISLVVMQIAKKIPFDDPPVLMYLRIGYVAAQLAILYAYYHVSGIIKQKNDQTILKYVEQPAPFSQEEPKLVVTTVKDYDLLETSKLLRGAWMGIGMMAIFHIYLHYNQPLFIQTLMGLKNLYSAKPLAIHILGKAAEGDLKRPFQSPGMFGAAGNIQTDNAAIAAAEKRVGASKKDD